MKKDTCRLMACNKVKTLQGVPAGFYNCVIENCEKCKDEIYVSESARDTRESMLLHKKKVYTLCVQCSDEEMKIQGMQ